MQVGSVSGWFDLVQLGPVPGTLTLPEAKAGDIVLSDDRRIRHPGGFAIACLGGLIGLGTLLLNLPVSHSDSDPGETEPGWPTAGSMRNHA